eukprot:scaffold7264_cov168-Amphora_coffeaeformis.AAC.3
MRQASLSSSSLSSSMRRLLFLCCLSAVVQAWQPSPSPSSSSSSSSSSLLRQETKVRVVGLRPRPTATKLAAEATSSTNTASRINPLLSRIQPSQTVEIFSRVKQMQAEGIDVTSLCVGEPDFLPPDAVLEAVTAAVAAGDTRYTAVTGTAPLRAAIAADLQRRKQGLQYNPQTEIVVGNGAKQCVYQGVLATVGAGDAVLIPAPYWPSYPEMAALCQAESVIVQTSASNGYLLTPEELRAALTEHDNVKLMILCNPSNPTGGVYSREQLQGLATVLKDFPHVTVLADEIYERLSYVGEVTSFATIDDMWDRTMTVNGFSKAYAMTGLRLGYLAAPQPLARAVTTIQSQFTSCAGSLSQAAGVAALTKVPDSVLEANVEIMKAKRDFVLEQLAGMPAAHVEVPPAGAFYVLPVVTGTTYGEDDVALCQDLLEEERLALVPGTSFGAPGTVRISYATSMEELTVAMKKLARFLKRHTTSS